MAKKQTLTIRARISAAVNTVVTAGKMALLTVLIIIMAAIIAMQAVNNTNMQYEHEAKIHTVRAEAVGNYLNKQEAELLASNDAWYKFW